MRALRKLRVVAGLIDMQNTSSPVGDARGLAANSGGRRITFFAHKRLSS